MLKFDVSHKIDGKVILNPTQFSLKPGKHLLILGDSGVGKTTLLSILTGMQKPYEGQVTYGSDDIYAFKPAMRDCFRGKNIGIIFQELHLIPVVSVRENLSLVSSMVTSETDYRYIDSLIDSLGLVEKSDQKAESLSIGEKQRVAIARALVNKPKWIFADEPTSALDDKNTKATLDLLISNAEKNGASLIVSTHDKRVKEAFAGQKVIELKGGGK